MFFFFFFDFSFTLLKAPVTFHQISVIFESILISFMRGQILYTPALHTENALLGVGGV